MKGSMCAVTPTIACGPIRIHGMGFDVVARSRTHIDRMSDARSTMRDKNPRRDRAMSASGWARVVERIRGFGRERSTRQDARRSVPNRDQSFEGSGVGRDTASQEAGLPNLGVRCDAV